MVDHAYEAYQAQVQRLLEGQLKLREENIELRSEVARLKVALTKETRRANRAAASHRCNCNSEDCLGQCMVR